MGWGIVVVRPSAMKAAQSLVILVYNQESG